MTHPIPGVREHTLATLSDQNGWQNTHFGGKKTFFGTFSELGSQYSHSPSTNYTVPYPPLTPERVPKIQLFHLLTFGLVYFGFSDFRKKGSSNSQHYTVKRNGEFQTFLGSL